MFRHAASTIVRLTALTAVAMFATASVAMAQATPEADQFAYPGHIHEGMCPEPGGVVFPLGDVLPVHDMMMATPEVMMATPDMMMDATPSSDMGMDPVIGESITLINAPLEDILAADHAINLHKSADEMSFYIACGDITGEPIDGMLEIELAEQNDSGVSGMATLMDNGDGTTTVTVQLHDASDMSATPMATPGS